MLNKSNTFFLTQKCSHYTFKIYFENQKTAATLYKTPIGNKEKCSGMMSSDNLHILSQALINIKT